MRGWLVVGSRMTRSSAWKPERFWISKPSLPVMMSGFWYSSPILRQKSASWRTRSVSSLYWSRSCLLRWPPCPLWERVSRDFSRAICRGGRSGSSTCSFEFDRSWFCKSRAVSEATSTSVSRRSVANPAMSTRLNPETSSLLWSGVSTGTSTKEAQPGISRARASGSALRCGRRRLLLGLAIAFVIGFPEQVVVLLDVDVGRLQLERLVVGGARTLEIALLLQGDGQVVLGLGAVGGQGRRALEPEPSH